MSDEIIIAGLGLASLLALWRWLWTKYIRRPNEYNLEQLRKVEEAIRKERIRK